MPSAACHIHSDWSYDGKWSLAALVAKFERRGYRILMVTDHDRGFSELRHRQHREACLAASSERMSVLPGIEYSDASNIIHVLVWGPVPFLGEGVPTLDVLKAVRATNGIAVLAHPSRREAWRLVEHAWADYLLGIEVWNRKTDGWAPSSAASRLIKGASVVPFVGLDFHDRKQFFPLTMQIDIRSSMIDEDSVLESLRRRRCCACVFGVPLNRGFYRWTIPALKTAESSRRFLARMYKRSVEREARSKKFSNGG
jgi:hypothetical protein